MPEIAGNVHYAQEHHDCQHRDGSSTLRYGHTMSMQAKQILIIAVLGSLVLIAAIRLSRRGQLSFRYTIGWICIGALGVLSGLLVAVADDVSRVLQLTPAALVGLTTIVLVLALTMQLSISISGLQRHVRVLAEENANLNMTIRDLQEALAHDAAEVE